MYFDVKPDDKDPRRYRWTLLEDFGTPPQVLAVSPHSYASKEAALKAIKRVQQSQRAGIKGGYAPAELFDTLEKSE